jgi:hypothetical protein
VTDSYPSLIVLVVLATGALLAAVARLVLPDSRRLAWSTTIVCAVAGAAIAWLPVDLLATDGGSLLRIAVGIAGAVAGVFVATTVLLARRRARARGHLDETTAQLVERGEGERIELKATARWNTRSSTRDQRMEEEVLLTVAGFMNASGGTLLLGVADDGSIHGLEDDYKVTVGKGRDGFELWLRTLFADRLGRAVSADVGVTFEAVEGHDICRVDVAPADRPVFVGGSGGAHLADFYLRVGNTTRKLLTDEVLEYRTRRWP